MNNQPQQYSKYKPLFFVSGLYFLIILIIAISKLNDFAAMTPNEWGDFLAGTFAPLAFMWLVFGYRLQGEELKQNTEALRLQSEELANSVEQQRQLVETARQELSLTLDQINQKTKHDLIQAQPFIHINSTWVKKITKENIHASDSANLPEDYYESIEFHVTFMNSRVLARELFIKIYHGNKPILEKNYPLFSNEKKHTLIAYLQYPNCFSDKDFVNLKVKFEYLDTLDKKQHQDFNFEFMRNDQFKLSPVLYERSSTSFQND